MEKKPRYIIDHVVFNDLPTEDMTAYEMHYLRTRYFKDGKITPDGLIDLIYSAYKLGYGKCCISMGKELPKAK